MKFVDEYKGFKVGDRVMVVNHVRYECHTGTIYKIDNEDVLPIDVILDNFNDGHDGYADDGSCNHRFFYPEQLTLLSTPKHKAGDTVTVRADLDDTRCYGGLYPYEQMLTKAGHKVKIKSVTKTGRYKIEGSCFTWTDEMFEGKVDGLSRETEKTNKIDKTTKITKKPSRTIVTVRFDSYGKQYYYLTTDKTINIGDDVVVPVGSGNHEKVARVTSVGKYRASTIDIPVSELKTVLRKGHVCYTKNFDWDKFLNGNLIVEVDSIEKMETFLSECEKNACKEIEGFRKRIIEKAIKDNGTTSFVYNYYRKNTITIESAEWHSIDRPDVMTFKWDKVVDKTVEKKVEDKPTHKYNVGDLVKIRCDLLVGKRYGCLTWLYKMEDTMAGKVVCIKEIRDCNYFVEIDNHTWWVTDEMIKGKYSDIEPTKEFKVGDIVKATTNDYIITNKNNVWCGIVTNVYFEKFNAKTIKGDEFGGEFHGLYMQEFELMK